MNSVVRIQKRIKQQVHTEEYPNAYVSFRFGERHGYVFLEGEDNFLRLHHPEIVDVGRNNIWLKGFVSQDDGSFYYVDVEQYWRSEEESSNR